MLVLDHDAGRVVLGRHEPKVVGTYRLLRHDIAARHGGFYTADEFDIGPMLARHAGRRFMELGRSCVLAPTAPSARWNCCGPECGPMPATTAST